MRALQTRRGPAPAAAVPVTGTRAALPAAVLLGGVVPVEGRRLWAHLIDAVLVIVAGLLTGTVAALAGLTIWSAVLLGALVAVGVLTAVLLRFTGVGRTPGLRALGLRVVDGRTALPPRLTRPRAALVVADLRAGRDPLRLQPTQTVVSATSETGRWQDLGETRRHVMRLTVDDGTTFTIAGPTLIGRDPVPPAGSVWEVHAITDLTRTIARNHALVEPQADGVGVTDLGSGNGTTGLTVDGTRQPVVEGARVTVPTGGRIAIGSRLLLVAAEKESRR